MQRLTAIWCRLIGLCLLFLLSTTTAMGKVTYFSQQRATHQQIVDAVRNSPYASPWLKQNANAVANLAINVESGGYLHLYNGSCCFGVLQLNHRNIRAYAHMSPEQYKLASLQTQLNAWSKLTTDGLRNPVVRRLMQMKTFDGRPVTGELVLACVQLGVGNCQKMLNSGRCGGFRDINKTSICDMADRMAKGRGTPIQPIEDGDLESASDAEKLDPGNNPVDASVLDQIMDTFRDGTGKWVTALTTAASWLFWSLAAISVVYTGIDLVFRKDDIAAFFAETIRLILFIGFFWWLLQNGFAISESIINSFNQLGVEAGTGGETQKTAGFVQSLFDMWNRAAAANSIRAVKIPDLIDITNAASWLNPELFVAILMMVVTFFALVLIAINYALLYIAAWIYMTAGLFVLGFGGGRWTSDMAISYYRQLLNIGLQLMTMMLMMAIGKNIITSMVSQTEGFMLFHYTVLLLVGLTLAILCTKVPPMVGSLAGGSGNEGIGFSAKSVVGSMLNAALMLLGGVGLVRQALKEVSARNRAQQQQQQ
ncbi:P-type conjugative transfer protein TrbL [Eikenella exigua]|uniref:P-type conjugative transfer protein TrbL n=1 Tax=Eikenella exigua TaxID=2528037 RepID=A0AAX1FAF0_9NEIS|nr:P-type conjugative transfer protein TrbL [Eikenella exigua]QED93001.1 P-type conjugative transfer protein TrbL [Eikenella exigua]